MIVRASQEASNRNRCCLSHLLVHKTRHINRKYATLVPLELFVRFLYSLLYLILALDRFAFDRQSKLAKAGTNRWFW